MSRTIRRVLTILLVVLLVLGGLGLGLFTWMAYWPFEKGVDSVDSLVPGEVDFVLRASWEGLKETDWLQTNLLHDPLLSDRSLQALFGRGRDATAGGDLREELQRAIALLEDNEAQINGRIPLGITTFSFEEDVVPGDVVVAGKWCEAVDPRQSPPRWYEIVVLTRVSWKAKLVAALKHGFVRETTHGNPLIEQVDDGLFRITIPGIPVSPERRRACGPEQVRPPENVWYLTRVRDVLALSNSQPLARSVQELGEFPDSGRGYVHRPHVELDSRPAGIAASMDVTPLQNYLVQTLDMVGSPATILQRYLTIPALHRLNGTLLLPSLDQVRAHATVRYQQGLLGSGVGDVYALDPEPPGSLVSNLVPAEDTFGALLLKTPPLHLLRGIYEDVLTEGDRRLWRDNVRAVGGYRKVEDLFREFASKLGDTAGIAFARVPAVFDTLDYPGFLVQQPMDFPDPEFPALAMIVRLRQDTSPAELDRYLAERVPLFGLKKEIEQKAYKGFTYTRGFMQREAADLVLVSPAWILAQNHFIFASNESYFRKILDTLADPKAHPPLADEPTFRAAMDELPERVHVALFLDLDKLFRVPPGSGVGEGPRGYLYDRRHLWVVQYRSARETAIRYRLELTHALRARTGQQPTEQQLWEIERQVDDRVTSHDEHYRDFVEEYRRILGGFERLRALGLGIVAEDEHLVADLALLLRSPAARERAPSR